LPWTLKIAQPVSGIASLNTGDHARADSVSRPSPGNCAVGGFYMDTAGRWQAFLTGERKGRWGRAIEVSGTTPERRRQRQRRLGLVLGTGRLRGGRLLRGQSVQRQHREVAVLGGHPAQRRLGRLRRQRAGRHVGKAITVPGTARLNAGRNAALIEMSCPRPGRCSAGGSYTDRSGHGQAFVVSRT